MPMIFLNQRDYEHSWRNGMPPRNVAGLKLATRVPAVPVTPAELWTVANGDEAVSGWNAAQAGTAMAAISTTAAITAASIA